MSSQSKSVINLLVGSPNPTLLPSRLLHQATEAVFSDPEILDLALSYGPDPGYEPLRVLIAQWLSQFYRAGRLSIGDDPPSIDFNRIVITGGASQSLSCLLQVFTDPSYTQHVWMVAPTYFQACRIFEDAGFAGKMKAVAEDVEGLDIRFLERALEMSERESIGNVRRKPILKPRRAYSKYYKHVVYAVPTFANPSGKVMTLQRRQDLIRLARRFDALVITDDVYDFVRWPSSLAFSSRDLSDQAPLPRIVDIDDVLEGGADRPGADGFGNAVSNASFSKICGPGNRTGWVEGSIKLAFGVANNGATLSGGAPSQLVATIIAQLLGKGHVQRHISDVLQPAHMRRYHTMKEAIETHLFPLGATMEPLQSGHTVVGGYFLVEENVILANGEMFQVWGDESTATFAHEIRVCFMWEDERLLVEGIARIANVMKRAMVSS